MQHTSYTITWQCGHRTRHRVSWPEHTPLERVEDNKRRVRETATTMLCEPCEAAAACVTLKEAVA
jgi:hypothetical protein